MAKTDDEVLAELIEVLDSKMGRGEWLEPGNYEDLRSAYNNLASAAEDVVTVYRRMHP